METTDTEWIASTSRAEALRAGVFISVNGVLLHSLWSFLRLVELSRLSGLALSGLALTSASLLCAWSMRHGIVPRATSRGIVLTYLVLAGPAGLYLFGGRGDGSASGLLLIAAVLVGASSGIELATGLSWSLRALMKGDPQEEDAEGAFRSWLLMVLHVLLPLVLLPVLRPYTGRLGAHLLVLISLTLWLFPVHLPMARRLVGSTRIGAGVWFVAWMSLFWAFFGWPWPHNLGGNDIIYTDVVGGQAVTVHARKAEKRVYYTVTTKRAVIHGTITAYRQGEMMVHPAMALNSGKTHKKILLLGSEDGAVLRELRRYKFSKHVVWVPLFPFWRDFFANAPLLSRGAVKADENMTLVKTPPLQDLRPSGMRLLQDDFGREQFDVIIADMPKVWNASQRVPKESFRMLLQMLKPAGVMSIQLASPYTQADYYWCLVGQLAGIGAHVVPYQLSPSLYQDYGYALVSRKPIDAFSKPLTLPPGTQYLRRSQAMSVLARFAKESTPNGRAMQRHCTP